MSVSARVFHRFPFDLLIHVSATQLSLFFCIPSVVIATDRTFEDAMHTSMPGSPTTLSQIWVLLMVLFLTLREQVADPAHGKIKSMNWPHNLLTCRFCCKAFPASKVASKRFHRQWPISRARLQVLSNWLAASQLALPPWKQVQLPPPVSQAQQDLGFPGPVDGSTATGSHGWGNR